MTDAPTPIDAANPPSRRFSMVGRIGAVVLVATFLLTGAVIGGARLGLSPALSAGLALLLVLPLSLWAVQRLVAPWYRTLTALNSGIRSFRDRDFGVRLTATSNDELGDLLRLYNTVGEILQEERQQIRQRELLLQTALDRSPIAIVLVNHLDRVLYANIEARSLFLGGKKLQGWSFAELLDACPGEMRAVLNAGRDGIFTVEGELEPETYHLSHRKFTLNRRSHSLILLRRMTAELARQEVEVWKKLIRILSHELNNSLAPISSMAHSARLVAQDPSRAHQLDTLFDGIKDRVQHLTRFLEGYARFARLPRPDRESVDWSVWLADLQRAQPFRLEGTPPEDPGWFDPGQLEQVLINLIKNAIEASPPDTPVRVRIDGLPDGRTRLQVRDEGSGMSDEVLRSALLPFYSTKPTGTGVGLPLCREIVEAHGGSLRIQSVPEEGTTVTIWLPSRPDGRPQAGG